jgi:hypothetical protein
MASVIVCSRRSGWALRAGFRALPSKYPNGRRLSACGLRVRVRRTCPGPLCRKTHNCSLRRQISLSSTRRDGRLAQLASVEAHHCIGGNAWRAVAEPAYASDFLIVGRGAKRMATTFRKRPATGRSLSFEKASQTMAIAATIWQSATEEIEHEISICVCSVLLTREQSGRFTQHLAIKALGN